SDAENRVESRWQARLHARLVRVDLSERVVARRGNHQAVVQAQVGTELTQALFEQVDRAADLRTIATHPALVTLRIEHLLTVEIGWVVRAAQAVPGRRQAR